MPLPSPVKVLATKSSHENFFRKKVSCYESPPVGIFFVSESFAFCGSSGDRTGDFVVCGVVVLLPFSVVFDRFR
jgi:hypothetical protein